MELPPELQTAILTVTQDYCHEELVKEAVTISRRYRSDDRSGQRLLTRESEAAAYAAARMPATFGAINTVLQDIADRGGDIKTVTDIGAGTGAAAWAADHVFNLDKITCLEREACMRVIGKRLMSGAEIGRKTVWLPFNLATEEISIPADLVIAGYILNELSPEARQRAIVNLWRSTKGTLAIIEPGTPAGYRNILSAREALIAMGGHIWAPCPHENTCPLTENDWCHFACRVTRTKQHRLLKGGSAPYEDEKFSFLIAGRRPAEKTDARVLRHPITRPGRIDLRLCTPEGIENKTVSKRDKAAFQAAKKAGWGSRIKQGIR